MSGTANTRKKDIPMSIYWVESELKDDKQQFDAHKRQHINNISDFPITFHFPKEHPLINYAVVGKHVLLHYDQNDNDPKELTIYDVRKNPLWGQPEIIDLELYVRK